MFQIPRNWDIWEGAQQSAFNQVTLSHVYVPQIGTWTPGPVKEVLPSTLGPQEVNDAFSKRMNFC